MRLLTCHEIFPSFLRSIFVHSGYHSYKEEESAAEGWMLVYNCGEIELCPPLGGGPNSASSNPYTFDTLVTCMSSSTTTCMQGRPGAPRAGRFTDEEEDSGADSMNDVMSSKSSHSCRWADIPRGLHLYTLSQVLGFTDATTPLCSSLSRPWIRATSRLWVLLWGLLCPFLPLPLLPTKPASGSSYAFQH